MTAHRSPRTFSLATLLLSITLISLLCGLAVNYPEVSLAFLLICSLFIPFAIVCLTLVSFSYNRKAVLASAIVGGLVSCALFTPAMQMGPTPRTILDAVGRECLPVAINAAFGALLLGVAALIADSYQQPNDPPGPNS
jgi:Na+/proline symporter